MIVKSDNEFDSMADRQLYYSPAKDSWEYMCIKSFIDKGK